MAKHRDTVRLSVEVSEDLNKLLEEMANESHITKSELLRRSITLMNFAQNAKERGHKIGSVAMDKQLDVEVVGI